MTPSSTQRTPNTRPSGVLESCSLPSSKAWHFHLERGAILELFRNDHLGGSGLPVFTQRDDVERSNSSYQGI